MVSSAPLAALFGLVLAATAAPAAELPELLLSRQAAEARGLAVGDVVRIAADRDGGRARPFRVAGLYEPLPDPFRLTARRFEARLHLPDLIDLAGAVDDPLDTETVTRLNVALRDPADWRGFERDLAARVPGVHVRPSVGVWDAEPFLVLERFHVAIAAVTVIGSAAFLLALMVMRAEERRESAGILRLIGFTRGRVLLEVFLEGACVAVAGTLFGLVLARILEGLFNRFFQWHYDTALVFVHVTPGIAVKCVAIALPLGILAGVVASWSLLRRDVVELLRR